MTPHGFKYIQIYSDFSGAFGMGSTKNDREEMLSQSPFPLDLSAMIGVAHLPVITRLDPFGFDRVDLSK